MATVYVDLTANSGWVLAGPSGSLAQNTQGASLHVTMQSSAPVATAAYHELRRGEAFEAIGAGSLYLRNPGSHAVKVPVTS